MLFTLLLALMLVAALGGGLGYSRWGYAGWSPLGVVVLVLLVLWVLGYLR